MQSASRAEQPQSQMPSVHSSSRHDQFSGTGPSVSPASEPSLKSPAASNGGLTISPSMPLSIGAVPPVPLVPPPSACIPPAPPPPPPSPASEASFGPESCPPVPGPGLPSPSSPQPAASHAHDNPKMHKARSA